MIDLEILLRNIRSNDKQLYRQKIDADRYDMENFLQAISIIGHKYNRNFTIDEDNRSCYESLVYWLVRDPRMMAVDPETNKPCKGDVTKGIYIAGPTGTGKTVAVKVIADLASQLAIKYRFGETGQQHILEWMEFQSDDLVDLFSHGETPQDVKKTPFLCIQDFGAEPSEAIYMGNRRNVLRSIIEYRGDLANQYTFITSNLPMGHPDLVAKYGDRVKSRLIGMCNYLVLKGKDRRITNAHQR